MRATFFAMCLIYLKKSSTGVDFTGTPWFTQLPRGQWGQKGYIGGYSSDDWVRSMVHFHYAVSRRYRTDVFGKSGVTLKPARPHMVLTDHFHRAATISILN